MASNFFIKGYCESCSINIPELVHATEDGHSIFLQFACPKCKIQWNEEYEFVRRQKVWGPSEEEIKEVSDD